MCTESPFSIFVCLRTLLSNLCCFSDLSAVVHGVRVHWQLCEFTSTEHYLQTSVVIAYVDPSGFYLVFGLVSKQANILKHVLVVYEAITVNDSGYVSAKPEPVPRFSLV